MKSSALISEFQKAKNDDSLVIIEGVQALKHAVRFNAEIYKIITCDADMLRDLINELAPDVSETVLQKAETIDEDTFRQLSSRPIRTKTITLAKKTDLQDCGYRRLQANRITREPQRPRQCRRRCKSCECSRRWSGHNRG